ncbi:MAG: T9SS type A sorting domain-containing protein [Luteolibacter sp.]
MKLPLLFLSATLSGVLAGPFPLDFIPAADSRFVLWATAVELVRGPTDIAYTGEFQTYPTFGTEDDAIGPADATSGNNGDPTPVVSLGDGGTATLTFASPLADIPGPDFAVFENAFSSTFLELAHVEVSSDGVNFFRFPSISLTQTATQIPDFSALDATNLSNLAGKAPGGSGTPFDLAQLRKHHPVLDIHRVTHVRVIDVVGSLSLAHRSLDSLGNPINDPYPTDHQSGGFDLDAVGAFSPVLTTYAEWTASRNLSGNDALPAADPDHDGIPNLIAYLTGETTLVIETTPTQTVLRFHRLAYRTGGQLRVETSSTFDNWQPLTGVTVEETGEHLVQVTVTGPSSPGRRFYRLAAEP